MVWVGRDLGDHVVPTPLPWAGLHPLSQAARDPIQFGLKHLQGSTSASLGSLCHCLTALSKKNLSVK